MGYRERNHYGVLVLPKPVLKGNSAFKPIPFCPLFIGETCAYVAIYELAKIIIENDDAILPPPYALLIEESDIGMLSRAGLNARLVLSDQ